MTLGELFEACEFDELQPCLRHCYDVDVNMWHFKEAFDVFSQMYQELKNVDDVTISEDDYFTIAAALAGDRDADENFIDPTINDFETEPLSVESLKRFRVRIMVHHISSEMALLVPMRVLKDLLALTKEDLLAHFLWEMTFYGLPEDKDEVYQKLYGSVITNKYEKAYWDLFGKMCDNEYPKAYRGKNSYPYGMELKRFNRSKRKRAYRQLKRCAVLERMGKIENAIQRLSPIPRVDLEYLFQTRLVHECTFHSRSYGKRDRIEYLLELFDRYDTADYTGESAIAIMLRASSECPITDDELSRMKAIEKRFNPSASILWGIGEDDTLEGEVSMLLVLSH